MVESYCGITTKFAPLCLTVITGNLFEHEGDSYIVGGEYSYFKGNIFKVVPASVSKVISYDNDGTAVLSDDDNAKIERLYLKLRDLIWH